MMSDPVASPIRKSSPVIPFPSQNRVLMVRRIMIDLPDSPSVIEALSNPELYEKLSSRFQQSPIPSIDLFTAKSKTCGTSSVCPAYEGKTESINGRDYNLYCINAPWGTYFWLPKAKSLSECEENCHKNSYDCNGLTFYPSTGACSLVYSTDAEPYIWDNGYQKIGAVPAKKTDTALGPGSLCPLPASDNQAYDFGPNKSSFKMSCLNQFQVPASAKKQLNTVKNVDECGEKCLAEKCYGFHYYQPVFPGGRYDGLRNCELITEPVGEDMWTPLFKPNQYLSGLKIDGDWKCGDKAWDQDNGCRK